jgi:uncharacterized membrane protein YagU involved in acid resistance
MFGNEQVEEEQNMKPNLSMALVGGVLGTPAMTALMYVLAPVFGVNTDIVTMLGEMLGGWRMGMLVHILNGAIIFPAVFAFLLYRFLPGSPIAKGTTFGVLLWLTSESVVLPIMGAGFFSAHIGGLKAAVASLLGHVVYGWFLGLFPTLAQEDLLENPLLASSLSPSPGRPEPKPQ